MPPKKSVAISADEFEELLKGSQLFDELKDLLESQGAVIDELENRIQICEEELNKAEKNGGESRVEPIEKKKSIVVGGSNHSSHHPIFGNGTRWHKRCSGRNCKSTSARLYCVKCDNDEIDKKALSLYCTPCILLHVRAKKCLERCEVCGEKSERVQKDKGINYCGLCKDDHEKGGEVASSSKRTGENIVTDEVPETKKKKKRKKN